jgi:hypothetical protein
MDAMRGPRLAEGVENYVCFLFERRMVSQECPQTVKQCTLLVVGILYGYRANWLRGGNPTG